MGEIKFTPKRRETFLEELRLLGLINMSARAAGISPQTVRNHREVDNEFDNAVQEALEDYAERVRLEVRRRAIEGTTTLKFFKGMPIMVPVVDEDGNTFEDEDGKMLLEPYRERQFSDRLLELEAKRVDPAYRDKGQLDVNVKSGVLVVPGAMTKEQWAGEGQETED